MQTNWWVLHYLYVQVHVLILNRFKSIFLCWGGGDSTTPSCLYMCGKIACQLKG